MFRNVTVYTDRFKNIITFLLLFLFLLLQCLLDATAFTTIAERAILIDADTGEVIFAKNPDVKTHPSSMTKIMTAYLIGDMIKDGIIKLDERYKVSNLAYRQGGTKMFVEINEYVTVRDLLYGLAVQSGNDAAIVLAEGSAGNVNSFVEQMNIKAKEFGMISTNYINPHGSISNVEHYSTVRDIAKISALLIKDHPEIYKYFGINSFTYKGIKQNNKNTLLSVYNGMDGTKTGFTKMGKYGLATSAERDGRRFISVVNELNKQQHRFNETIKLLDYGFATSKVELFKKGDVVGSIDVNFAIEDKVELITIEDIYVNVLPYEKSEIKASIEYESDLLAPIEVMQKLGTLVIETPSGYEVIKIQLYANKAIEKSGFFRSILQKINYKYSSNNTK